LTTAYTIRLHAIETYGHIIHEFDPYFNFRAAQYLYDNGWQKFCTWFDYMSWYPLGRPVGTTIYPGMQVTAVWLVRSWLPMSLNDVCCLLPAWFGAWATLITGFPSHSRSTTCLQTTSLLSMLATMYFMGIVPAHIMRSVGGGYDNESVAMTAMILVFYLWTRSLLSSSTMTAFFWGSVTGVAYFYMVASWGGYVFVINLVGAHCATLILLGRHSSKLHAAYSAFYFVGTLLATRVLVVGTTPLRSLEQLGPLLVFLGIQIVEYCERVRTRDNLTRSKVWLLRLRFASMAAVVLLGVGMALWPTGYFGPISSRVRGLFVKHTKTGNPLVDSVAEHQAAKAGTYEQYLKVVAKIAPIGFGMVAIGFANDASSFLLVYGLAAYFFSHKMVRLILLTAPIASVLAGLLVGRVAGFCVEAVTVVQDNPSKKAKKKKSDIKETEEEDTSSTEAASSLRRNVLFQISTRIAWLYLAFHLYTRAQPELSSFKHHCQQMAVSMSHPTILVKAQTNDGHVVLVDDYREAYWWLRDNTPEDSRIMAWWDYGYQITAIANRTTIADGNTWNHEHIALLGRALTSPLKEGHRIARHLADYVLLWTGGGGDDLAKSPHLARIANSVYRQMCPGDPTCSKFGAPGGHPSKMMQESLLYRLHSNGLVPGVEVDKNRFKEVYKTKYGKVRIYKVLSVSKESKEWVANNRVCDAPGSWFCRGQYPPGLQKVLREKKDFKQLED
ncbi:oliosaccharyl transferase, partial [Thalassiosira pseudonana CCMP1335]